MAPPLRRPLALAGLLLGLASIAGLAGCAPWEALLAAGMLGAASWEATASGRSGAARRTLWAACLMLLLAWPVSHPGFWRGALPGGEYALTLLGVGFFAWGFLGVGRPSAQ